MGNQQIMSIINESKVMISKLVRDMEVTGGVMEPACTNLQESKVKFSGIL